MNKIMIIPERWHSEPFLLKILEYLEIPYNIGHYGIWINQEDFNLFVISKPENLVLAYVKNDMYRSRMPIYYFFHKDTIHINNELKEKYEFI